MAKLRGNGKDPKAGYKTKQNAMLLENLFNADSTLLFPRRTITEYLGVSANRIARLRTSHRHRKEDEEGQPIEHGLSSKLRSNHAMAKTEKAFVKWLTELLIPTGRPTGYTHHFPTECRSRKFSRVR